MDTKTCPECGAEYFSHVTTCKRCDTLLVSDTAAATPQASAPPDDSDAEDLVCIEECRLDRAQELVNALEKIGFKSKTLKMGSTKTCGAYGVFVAGELIADEAIRKLDEHWRKLYPELKGATERANEGQCPACGADASASPDECPDCGLKLGFGRDDGNCGGCG
ncbi:MAG: hypothetical protein HY886_11005 [Deltaproteobacteria bacterium]|nr:hypothetical protein [Deltaproteobacteria bacterium]